MIGFVAIFAKIIATSFTLGWGGSGGIFAPGLVIGSLVGISFYRIIHMIWPEVSWMSEGCFGLLGMAGVISGMLQAPLTGIFLIVEVTGGYEVILPLILVSSISSTLCCFFEPASFYLKDLMEKGQLLRPGTDARVLADLSIIELIETDCLGVKNNMLLRDFITIFQNSKRNYFPVEDYKTGAFLGIINLDNVKPYLFDDIIYDAILLEQIMDKNKEIDIISLEDDLSEVLKLMDDKNLFSLPVISNKKFIGMISKATILNKYRTELMTQSTK
jgi:CIC family chloride channel protein